MKVESIAIGSREGRDALENLLSTEKVIAKKIDIVPTENNHIAYVFYEDAEEQLAAEKEELSQLDKVAQELEKDEAYGKLKNSTQREIFILQKYNLPSSLAKKTIELVNMRKILQEG